MNIEQAHNLSTSFFLAFQRCMERRPLQGGGFQFPIVPAIVCAAFSVEAGFKAILLTQKGKAPKGHNLLDLFKDLSPATRALIEGEAALEQATFLAKLRAVADAFVDWRYYYERDGDHQISLDFLAKLAAATQKASAATR